MSKSPAISRFFPGRVLLFLLLLVAAVGPAGCATSPRVDWDAPAVTELQWPLRSASPRIRWVRSIAGPRDAGITSSFWQRARTFFTGAPGPAIVRPHGVLYDTKDRLFIADPGAGIVHGMDIGSGKYFLIGADKDARLHTPIGLAVDDRQRLYISDAATGFVYRYEHSRRSLQPLLAGRLQRPTGIAWNPVNRLLYIVDTTANQIVAVNEDGAEQFRIGGNAGPIVFNRPVDIWADAQGQLYVTDPLNARIKVFSPEGQLLHQFGIAGDAPGEFNKPKGVATDSAGHIYVADALLDAVQIFDTAGQPLLTFGAAGTGNGELWMPSGIFIDRQDRIFVADTYNRRVQVFRYLPEAAPAPRVPRERTMP